MSFYFVVRNAFVSIELIETFLYRHHKLKRTRLSLQANSRRVSRESFQVRSLSLSCADYEIQHQIVQERHGAWIYKKWAQFERNEEVGGKISALSTQRRGNCPLAEPSGQPYKMALSVRSNQNLPLFLPLSQRRKACRKALW
jgi:hypothetical protein